MVEDGGVLGQAEKQNQLNLAIAYNAAKRKVEVRSSFGDVERDAFKLLLEKRKVLFLNGHQDSSGGQLRLPAEHQSLAFSPLVFRNKFMGILIVEDIDAKNFEPEGLKIIANQLSLELARVLLYQKIQQLAITDGLTGLFVRRHFLERLEEEIKRSKRYDLSLSFLMADIDHFKECNDAHGHLIGDVVLREVAAVLKENIREIDLAGRYGGEEFAVVLPDTTLDDAIQVAERIRHQVDKTTFSAYGEKLSSQISIGIAVLPGDSSTSSGLIKKADEALYRAKTPAATASACTRPRVKNRLKFDEF